MGYCCAVDEKKSQLIVKSLIPYSWGVCLLVFCFCFVVLKFFFLLFSYFCFFVMFVMTNIDVYCYRGYSYNHLSFLLQLLLIVHSYSFRKINTANVVMRFTINTLILSIRPILRDERTCSVKYPQ